MNATTIKRITKGGWLFKKDVRIEYCDLNPDGSAIY